MGGLVPTSIDSRAGIEHLLVFAGFAYEVSNLADKWMVHRPAQAVQYPHQDVA